MIFYIVYIACIVILVLHFTQFLARRNLQWMVLVAPFAIFAVNILKYMNVI